MKTRLTWEEKILKKKVSKVKHSRVESLFKVVIGKVDDIVTIELELRAFKECTDKNISRFIRPRVLIG